MYVICLATYQFISLSKHKNKLISVTHIHTYLCIYMYTYISIFLHAYVPGITCNFNMPQYSNSTEITDICVCMCMPVPIIILEYVVDLVYSTIYLGIYGRIYG